MGLNDSRKNYKWANDKVAPPDPYQVQQLYMHTEAINMSIFGIK